MAEYVKPVDYYDRIADALETLAGDSSHVNDEYPTMDYYDRIADALETLATNGISGGGGSCNCQKLVVTATLNENDIAVLNKTWQEIYDIFSVGGNVVIIFQGNDMTAASIVKEVVSSGNYYCITAEYGNVSFYTTTASGYPANEAPVV